jgi:hypothetical protein
MNRFIVPARQATEAGGIHSLESIPGIHKCLKIRALKLCRYVRLLLLKPDKLKFKVLKHQFFIKKRPCAICFFAFGGAYCTVHVHCTVPVFRRKYCIVNIGLSGTTSNDWSSVFLCTVLLNEICGCEAVLLALTFNTIIQSCIPIFQVQGLRWKSQR